MQIILLSGGSGKRLWPLSNGTRSKQFLQLLQTPNGERESMVQRVLRQISEAALTSSVTIATSEAQLDSIKSQLGSSVDIVTEPERRDTFPAIALSASYLALEKGCSRNEVVVVMPCDSYTERKYFDTIRSMAELAQQGVADLILMGITPTYPSTRYGYVVPAESDTAAYKTVQCFTEKPNAKKAIELLEQNAYWNGGVFAFRLGYMMDIVDKYVKSDKFSDLRNRYAEFPKISFDYEVAEKAVSVAVVPYSGQWKDLGTWNTLAEELPQHILGNVILGNNVPNCTVINELNTPIVCDGVSNIVIAANHDGILVCSKEASENIKQYVDHISLRPMYEERRWGKYQVLDDTIHSLGGHSLTKSVTLKPGKFISYHKHNHHSEVWILVDGEGLFVLNGEIRKVKAGDTVIIPTERYHAIKATSELTFIEVQFGNPLIEEDIERSEWNWG